MAEDNKQEEETSLVPNVLPDNPIGCFTIFLALFGLGGALFLFNRFF